MSAEPPILDLLWRQLDGDSLTMPERQRLERALAADPGLQLQASLRRQSRQLTRGLQPEAAPTELADRIGTALRSERAYGESPGPDHAGKILRLGLPLQRVALVASLLIAMLGLLYVTRGTPPSHEAALIAAHHAAVDGEAALRPLLSAVSAEPGWLTLGDLRLPATHLQLTGQRECAIIDCPATHYFGQHGPGVPFSIFVVPHTAHFRLAAHYQPVGSPALRRDYGVLRGAGANMVAWIEADQLFSLVAELPAGDLLALAEQGIVQQALLPAVTHLALLEGEAR